MFWNKLWNFLKSLWLKLTSRKTSGKYNTSLDTASLRLFGMDLKVTREVSVDVPYELTVVVPRAELRENKSNGSREIILSSITIAHSPRFKNESGQEKPIPSKPAAA